ncbi:MAG TPA: hypothetical protein DCE24_08355 [Porphyromonadaceae bacterium]|nr:hypothetical protein [Porphyromonadaceae bacterium]
MTLKELYLRQKNKTAPGLAFIREVAMVTKKSEVTVRKWLGGDAVPDGLTQKTLADYFGFSPEDLFPTLRKS